MSRGFGFDVEDRAIGRLTGPASFRLRIGTVRERGPGKSEYGIQFDNGVTEWVQSHWIERLAGTEFRQSEITAERITPTAEF
jgi:hypothetical protein